MCAAPVLESGRCAVALFRRGDNNLDPFFEGQTDVRSSVRRRPSSVVRSSVVSDDANSCKLSSDNHAWSQPLIRGIRGKLGSLSEESH